MALRHRGPAGQGALSLMDQDLVTVAPVAPLDHPCLPMGLGLALTGLGGLPRSSTSLFAHGPRPCPDWPRRLASKFNVLVCLWASALP
jgi:hypothetical protein